MFKRPLFKILQYADIVAVSKQLQLASTC